MAKFFGIAKNAVISLNKNGAIMIDSSNRAVHHANTMFMVLTDPFNWTNNTCDVLTLVEEGIQKLTLNFPYSHFFNEDDSVEIHCVDMKVL